MPSCAFACYNQNQGEFAEYFLYLFGNIFGERGEEIEQYI